MSFGCSNKELQKFKNRILNTQWFRFKKFQKCSTNVTQKLVHSCYSKLDPQLLLKNWTTNVSYSKFTNKRYSKADPQLLLKNWHTNDTQKVIRNCYSRTEPQKLPKKWPITFTQKLTHNCYSKIDPHMLLKIYPQTLLKTNP